MAIATFGAGCFWSVEETFAAVDGVTDTQVGYMGGSTENPDDESVATGETGHAEVVQIEYDPDQVSYDELLTIFWASHDPTTPDQQGADIGPEYRSVIFAHTPEQDAAAHASREAESLSGRHIDDVVTEICPADRFWLAAPEHQGFLSKQRR